MIVHNMDQGTPEWYQARAGVITASMFRDICKYLDQGKFSKAIHKYANKLAIERAIGDTIADGNFETWQMRRGKELESEARILHEIEIGMDVVEVGFVTTDNGNFGASPDGLIADDMGAEYKCFVNPDLIVDILTEQDFSEVMHQVQGGMWITDRQYWDFVLYVPSLEPIGLQLHRWTIERDQSFIDEMVRKLEEFNMLVDDLVAKLLSLKNEPTQPTEVTKEWWE